MCISEAEHLTIVTAKHLVFQDITQKTFHNGRGKNECPLLIKKRHILSVFTILNKDENVTL